MTTNKPKVQRYDDMGCPEEICRVDSMRESDDGDYVLYEDYEALQAECEKLVGALERIANMDSRSYHSLETAKVVARAVLRKQEENHNER